MNRMIASCGLICTECPAFLAHKNDDEQLRIKTAKQWSKEFKADRKKYTKGKISYIKEILKKSYKK